MGSEDTSVKTIRLAACAAVAVMLWPSAPRTAQAHTFLRNYIQHHALIAVAPKNIDVTLELTFNENCSAAERAKMDTNHDGRISSAEVERYLSGLTKALEKGFALSVAGQVLELVPLYDAKLDLMGDTRVRPHTHVLRLYLFARTPESLKAGSVIELKDSLWSDTGALRSVEVGGADGFRFSSVPVRESGVWRAKCQAVPTMMGDSRSRQG